MTQLQFVQPQILSFVQHCIAAAVAVVGCNLLRTQGGERLLLLQVLRRTDQVLPAADILCTHAEDTLQAHEVHTCVYA